jgi:hypothetical protein
MTPAPNSPGTASQNPSPGQIPSMIEPMTETTDFMLGFVLSLLAPFLAAGSITDPALIRLAAAETIAAYNAPTPDRPSLGHPSPDRASPDRLIATAQAVAFALTSVDNLRLSLPAGLSLSMKLKLRGNANALHRSSQQATATLEAHPQDTEPPDPTAVLAALETAKTEVRKAQAAPPTQPSTDRQIDLNWAGAMTDIATEFTTELAQMPPAQRRTHLARIGALSTIATTLGAGNAPPLKARLLGTTALYG